MVAIGRPGLGTTPAAMAEAVIDHFALSAGAARAG